MHRDKRNEIMHYLHPGDLDFKTAQLKPHKATKRHIYTMNNSHADYPSGSLFESKVSRNKFCSGYQTPTSKNHSTKSKKKNSISMLQSNQRNIVSDDLLVKTSTKCKKQNNNIIYDLLGLENNTQRDQCCHAISVQEDRPRGNCNHGGYQNGGRQKLEVEMLKKQNQELMRSNQQLLYEKEFYRQKMIMQEVQIRDLNRKLAAASSEHKRSATDDSSFTFKLHPVERVQQSNIKSVSNYGLGTSKSSLLISESQEQRPALADKASFENIYLGNDEQRKIQKAQNQFAQLLENVQSQSNHQRKMTLRKMLAIKAMELKKVKQKH